LGVNDEPGSGRAAHIGLAAKTHFIEPALMALRF
jgi:hypothetical protein